MAKEMTINVWCDACAITEQREPGQTTPPIAVGNHKPRTLDLCDAHTKELVTPLLDLLVQDGVMVEGGPSVATLKPGGRKRRHSSDPSIPRGGVNGTPGPFDCKVADCTGRHSFVKGGRGYPNLGALKAHISYAHELSFPDYVDAYGEPQAEQPPDHPSLLDEPALPDPGPDFTCGIDGCTKSYPPDDYKAPKQALGVHRARAHGVPGANAHPVRATASG